MPCKQLRCDYHPTMSQPPIIVYANDPLCGWCFAIGPSLLAAREELGAAVTWELAMGGLVVGERVRSIALDAQYLAAGLERVFATSGRRAGPAYWDKVVKPGTWISNSEPVCRAVVVAQQLAPERAMAFSHGLTDALYLHGEEPDHPETIRKIALEKGLDAELLLSRWQSEQARCDTESAFRRARSEGVSGYPGLMLREANRLKPLLFGYASTPQIVATIRAHV
jgi:putative protein-disulfide isomerase